MVDCASLSAASVEDAEDNTIEAEFKVIRKGNCKENMLIDSGTSYC